MKLNKLQITSKTAHFGIPSGTDYRRTYFTPPPSTILGMLRVIYGEDIIKENFSFGYDLEYESKFIDVETIYKFNIKKQRKDKTDCCKKEYLFDCKLNIYHDINIDKFPINMEYILCMGASNNLARLHFPINQIEIINKEGQGYNQFTPIRIGTGKIESASVFTKYSKKFESFDNQYMKLRQNKVFDYNKNYDPETNRNIYLYQFKEGRVIAND